MLHASIALGVGLQVLTLVVPSLRRFLGLASLDAGSLGILALAVFVTWAAAALVSRAVRYPSSPDRGPDEGRPRPLTIPATLV